MLKALVCFPPTLCLIIGFGFLLTICVESSYGFELLTSNHTHYSDHSPNDEAKNESPYSTPESEFLTQSSNTPGFWTYIKYVLDTSYKIPLVSLTFLDEDNHPTLPNNVNAPGFDYNPAVREDYQTSCSNSWANYDRGHLTPAQPFLKFKAQGATNTAFTNTFFCTNVAPQNPYTNQHIWTSVEDAIYKNSVDYPGLVMTGTCRSYISVNPSVPKCFFKLYCYRDPWEKIPIVVGFLGLNYYFDPKNEKELSDRKCSTLQPYSLSELLAAVRKCEGGLWDNVIGRMWPYASEVSDKRKGADRNYFNAAPHWGSCEGAGLPDRVRKSWGLKLGRDPSCRNRIAEVHGCMKDSDIKP